MKLNLAANLILLSSIAEDVNPAKITALTHEFWLLSYQGLAGNLKKNRKLFNHKTLTLNISKIKMCVRAAKINRLLQSSLYNGILIRNINLLIAKLKAKKLIINLGGLNLV